MAAEGVPADQKPRRKVSIVPHTHWDREWYAPFQTFRLKLVDLLDAFLPRLEADPAFTHFVLDGQMAMVDDYLAVRPDAEERLRRLATAGRVSLGPWYVLMDEFLVSGETIVRDLQLGIERAARFGGAMPVGYLPDMFGHVAQMPQLLRLAGLEHAVVWRGVPSAIDRSAFWWSAPDGSTVRAEYLPFGYGNGTHIGAEARDLVRRVRAEETTLGDFLLDGLLFMNGSDHVEPEPWLGRVVAEANDTQDDYRFVVTSLPEYLADAPTDGLPSWTGELRSGARANLLMGVASNRVDVKQAAAVTERALERLTEPLSALFLPPDRWPGALLDEAWLAVVRNAAHDSICACSADEVVDAVVHRFAEARQIAEGLTERALAALATSLAEPGTVVVNPSARARGGVVELLVEGDLGPMDAVQPLAATPAPPLDVTLPAAALRSLLDQTRSRRLGESTWIDEVKVDDGGTSVDVVLWTAPAPGGDLDLDACKADLLARVADRPDAPVRIHTQSRARAPRPVLAHVGTVPGFGWRTWTAERLSVPPVEVDGSVMENGLVRLEVDVHDGTFSVDGHPGLGRLVDDGDAGDTYNYSPPPGDVVVDRPTAVTVEPVEKGPVRGRLEVVRTFVWPAVVAGGVRSGERTVDVTTVLELCAGDDFVRVTTSFENKSRDHRLRAWFPLPRRATTSRAECAFGVVERGLDAEGGPSERALPTFPSRRFVSAGGITLVHEGLLEYELTDGGRALALTLLRATGMLSQVEMAYRPLPAGPPLPVEGPQLQRPLTMRYAVHVGDRDPYAVADDVLLPLLVARAPGGGTHPPEGSALSVSGAEVSAVRRRPGGVEVRVFNPTPAPTTVTIDGRWGWLVDLRGQPLELFDGRFDLRPWGIATVLLNED